MQSATMGFTLRLILFECIVLRCAWCWRFPGYPNQRETFDLYADLASMPTKDLEETLQRIDPLSKTSRTVLGRNMKYGFDDSHFWTSIASRYKDYNAQSRLMMGLLASPEREGTGPVNKLISSAALEMAVLTTTLGGINSTTFSIDKCLKDRRCSKFHRMFARYNELLGKSYKHSTVKMANLLLMDDRVISEAKNDFLNMVNNWGVCAIQPVSSRPGDTFRRLQAFWNAQIAVDEKRKMKGYAFPGVPVGRNSNIFMFSLGYFKANWAVGFDKSKTKPMQFSLADGQKIKLAKGMNGKDMSLRIAVAYGVIIVELPFENSDYNLYVGMPWKSDSGDIAIVFDRSKFDKRLRFRTVSVRLPAFMIRDYTETSTPLEKLGLATFDLSEASTVKTSLGWLINKSMVEVGEEGGKQVKRKRKTYGKTIKVHFNRPFAFMIYDKRFGYPLFLGHIANPDSCIEGQATCTTSDGRIPPDLPLTN